MAIIKFGITIVGARGEVGGGVFSANASGPYLKSWQYPVVKRTADELHQRARLAELPTAWRGLTAAIRTAWNTLAASAPYARTNSLGETYNLTGYQMFCSWARIKQTAQDSIFLGTPTATIPTPPPDVAADADESAGTMRVLVTAGVYTGNIYGYIQAQPIRSSVLAAFPNRWIFMRLWQGTPPATPSIFTQYTAAFGPLQTGQAFAVRIRRAHIQGAISTGLEASAVVVA